MNRLPEISRERDVDLEVCSRIVRPVSTSRIPCAMVRFVGRDSLVVKSWGTCLREKVSNI